MNNSQKILSIIMDYIAQSGKTAKDCLLSCEINTSFLTDWKNQKIKSPSYDKIVRLAEYLNIDINYLFTGKETKSSLSEDALNLLEMYEMLTDMEKGEILGELKQMTKKIRIHTAEIAARSTNNDPPKTVTGDFSDILNAPDSTDDYKT